MFNRCSQCCSNSIAVSNNLSCPYSDLFPGSDYFLVNTVKINNFIRKMSSFAFNMYLQSSSGCPSPAVCQAHCPNYKIIRFICSQSGLKQKVTRSTSVVMAEEDEKVQNIQLWIKIYLNLLIS